MAIATSGYMTVIIDFSGLVATRRQADPRANRSGLLEVVWRLNGCAEGGCGDRADAGNGHKDAASLTLARVPDQLAPDDSYQFELPSLTPCLPCGILQCGASRNDK